MIPKELNDWLQVLGLFGVIGGLIFVGLQVSLERQVALSEGMEASIANRQQWAELVGTNSDVWVKGLAGEPLTSAEEATFAALANARQVSYFNDYTRSVRGLADQVPERWVLQFAEEMQGNPGFVRWWNELRVVSQARRDRLGQTESPWETAVSAELERLQNDDLSAH